MNTFDTEQETLEDFCIDSQARAEWLLRKLANIEAEKARVTAQAADICKELETDRESLLFRYGLQLQQWAEEELKRRGGRKKTLRTLQGTLNFRHQGAGLRLYDADAALQHARSESLPVLKTTVSLDTAAYRTLAEQRFAETGVTLPGVETTPERENFSITFGKAE